MKTFEFSNWGDPMTTRVVTYSEWAIDCCLTPNENYAGVYQVFDLLGEWVSDCCAILAISRREQVTFYEMIMMSALQL